MTPRRNVSVLVNSIIFLQLVTSNRAIIAENQTQFEQQNEIKSSNNSQAIIENKPDDAKKLEDNSTFYYDSEAFVINRNDKTQGAGQQQQPLKDIQSFTTPKVDYNDDDKPPASLSMISGRNGRMLDLDAMIGDYAASKANKLLISGNRQSRYLAQSPTEGNLDIGGGKRLHIQGFIPIVGVKDDSSDDDNSSEQSNKNRAQREPKPTISDKNYAPITMSNNELPYAQSSIGHASFINNNGVQRYLNTDQSLHQQQQFSDNSQLIETHQIDPKFSGAASTSVVESLKRPIKKLANFASLSSSPSNDIPSNRMHGTHQQQNCLCVPFYMCKNGLINESSLGRSQIQQMIIQQQHLRSQQQQQHGVQTPQQPRQIDQIPLDLRRGGVSPPVSPVAPQSLQQQQQAAYIANAHPLIDERSFDREIITASPIDGQSGMFLNNETIGMQSDSFLAFETMSQTSPSPPITAAALTSSTTTASPLTGDEHQNESAGLDIPLMQQQQQQQQQSANDSNGQSNDYTQDILGRMLGLKLGNSKISDANSAESGISQPGPSGTCGLLRTCCQIPTQSIPGSYQQQDNSNERISTMAGQNSNKIQLMKQHQSMPFGLPMQVSHMQPAVNNYPMASIHQQQQQPNQNSLAHRTNQYQSQRQQMINQAQLSINQLARASPQMQPLQAFQQQTSLKSKSWPLQLSGMAQQANLLGGVAAQQMIPAQSNNQPIRESIPIVNSLGNSNNNYMGTRKILEGRCGLRQSAGITGRVQSLQYHENSADFGEYPAQAAILKRLNANESLFVCGGTMISQFWIATAAHCIKKHVNNDLKVRLGEWDVHRDDEFYPFVEKDVRDIVIHPEFVPGNLVNDLALIRLDSAVDASLPHVNPACLPTIDESFTKQLCYVTGWGKDSFGQIGSFQSVLKEVELPIIGHQDCEQALKQTRLGPHYRLHSGFMCAGGEGGKDACEGDGGSGLYCVQDGMIKVAGLVSWGIGCGQQGVPGVYVNLAHYRPWIENIISIDEDIYSKNSAPSKAS